MQLSPIRRFLHVRMDADAASVSAIRVSELSV